MAAHRMFFFVDGSSRCRFCIELPVMASGASLTNKEGKKKRIWDLLHTAG
jgi:hypothetical protein